MMFSPPSAEFDIDGPTTDIGLALDDSDEDVGLDFESVNDDQV